MNFHGLSINIQYIYNMNIGWAGRAFEPVWLSSSLEQNGDT